jgi:hypothetical protein
MQIILYAEARNHRGDEAYAAKKSLIGTPAAGPSDGCEFYRVSPLPRVCLLNPLLLAGLQIKGVLSNLFNNVFGLHLAFEPPQSAFNRFALV